MVHDACVDHGTAAGHFAFQLFGQGFEFGETIFGAYATATADKHFGLADVGDDFFFLDSFDNFDTADFLLIELDGVVDDFALAGGVGGEFLHHAGTDGRHLGAMFFAENGGHEVAAEGGTGHAEFVSFVVADFELGGVGGEAGQVACGDTGPQVAADGGGTDQQNAGVLFLDDLGDGLGVGLGEVGSQEVVVDHEHFVGASGNESLGLGLDVFAKEDGHYFLVVGIGQFASFT